MKYLIINIGCHDETYTEMELDDTEFKTIMKFIKENNETGGGCKPKLEIYDAYKHIYDKNYDYYDYDDREELSGKEIEEGKDDIMCQ